MYVSLYLCISVSLYICIFVSLYLCIVLSFYCLIFAYGFMYILMTTRINHLSSTIATNFQSSFTLFDSSSSLVSSAMYLRVGLVTLSSSTKLLPLVLHWLYTSFFLLRFVSKKHRQCKLTWLIVLLWRVLDTDQGCLRENYVNGSC